ncbi:MAG: serpin family protein, partial [candidate division Zixibacteria bacterium]
DIMYLLNAVYFKSSWTSRFEEYKTRDLDFTLLSGDIIQHPLMENSGDYPYYEDSAIQAIRLPYGNGTFGMVVILPREDMSLETLSDQLTGDYWLRLQQKLYEWEGKIVLPRFTIEYETSLVEPLKQLGMIDAFSRSAADFSRMFDKSYDTNISIDDVRHKTYVKVNEEGTEAAAVTSVQMVLTDAVSIAPQPFEMIVNRPFVCAIVNRTTGLILFVGVIVNPAG